MRLSSNTIVCLAWVSCLLLLLSCASAARKMTGSVRIYGSEPHTYAGITDEKDGKLYLVNDQTMEAELRELQGRRIEFRVQFVAGSSAWPPADGIVAVISYKTKK